MFFAALMSRSCRVPHPGHVQCRVERLSSASRYPHAEQVLLDGYQRPVTTNVRPYRSHLYSIWRRNSRHPQPEIARASDRFRTMFLTARSSMTTMSFWRISRVLTRCRKSCRALRIFRWARATFALALARFADPRWQRAILRWYRARLRALRSRCRGFAIRSPSLVTAKSFTPRSTPTARPPGGSGSGLSVSVVKVTYHRLSGSRDMITMAGSSVVASTSGHDHTYRSWPSVLASRRTPPRMENADRV